MTDQVEVHEDAHPAHRTLVLSHEGLGGELLAEQLDRDGEVFVVVPALSGSLKQLANDDREEIAAAQADLDRLLATLGAGGRNVSGIVGDSDPRLALEDSLRQFAADEVVVVNPAESEMERLEEVSTARAVEDVPLPVSVLTVPGA
jgi:hypothetical protein